MKNIFSFDVKRIINLNSGLQAKGNTRKNAYYGVPNNLTKPASFQRKLEPSPYSLESFCHNIPYLFQQLFQANDETKNSPTLSKATSLKGLGPSFRWNDAMVEAFETIRRPFNPEFRLISLRLRNVPVAVLLATLLAAQVPVMPQAQSLPTTYCSWSKGCALKDIQRVLRNLTPAQAYQLDMMARTVYGEARGEQSLRSLEAVAHVILNRAKDESKRWPSHIIGVIKQKLQFSCWNSNDPNAELVKKVTLQDADFRRCYRAVLNAMQCKNGIRGANHYHTTDISPDWIQDKNMIRVAQIGNHIFYRA